MQRRFFVHEGGNTAMKKVIELRNVTKRFDGETVLDSINLDIYDNEFLTLLGPSGCGKTTTLRMIGGFETPDQGDILFLGVGRYPFYGKEGLAEAAGQRLSVLPQGVQPKQRTAGLH